ncbi:Ger(x)C family spore germination protein [Ureibacillus acetophenoni]|uniref:Spore germination protein n=1 Tax=Ureibacillus acetophenoni TaxID=614649 RepID=A0A285U7H0_9BACL|nr:Ger(x)C family spore germination protein [Ureibacillus acetophenoni]SOC37348.1 spore germination protein [Ureibacillus acetophenoni]
MIKRQVLLYYLCISLLLFGCADPKILERVSLAILVGYDVEEEDKVTATVALRTVNQELQSVVSIASQTEKTSKGTRIKASLDSTKQIVAGQLRVILLGKKLAESGINEALHTTKMNSEMSSGLYFAIVDGETKPLIEKKYENISDIGQHIFYLLDHNIEEQTILSSTLHETVRDSYSPYIDMALPLLVQDEDDVHISGLAIFNGDKMVGKLVGSDPFYVVLVREKYNAGSIQLSIPGEPFKNLSDEIPDEIAMAIDSIFSKRKIELLNKDTPEFEIDVKVEGRILEIPPSITTEDPEVIKKLETEVEKKFEREISRIIKKTQELNSDVFGFGEVYKAHVGTKNVDKKKWKELYPTIKVNANVTVKLLRNGVFD